jgi:uncharacterized protein (TIGR02996 family)
MSSLREALEAALVENPDDVSTHRAYADYLQEQGDPRGEFIQVQLALEDESKSAAEREDLRAREKELLDAHAPEWLGALADELLGRAEPQKYRFARGWLDRIVIRDHGENFARELARAPQTRLLRGLILESDEGVALGLSHYRRHCATDLLARSPFLTNVRVLQVGERPESDWYESFRGYTRSPGVPGLMAKTPRLEELYLFTKDYDPAHLFTLPTLGRLRVLQVYHLEAPYSLETLAGNPALGELTHLLLHPHYSAEGAYITLNGARAVFTSPHLRSLTHLQLRCSDLGDVGCTDLVTSGVLKRLKVLDLRHGAITDRGARTLADCPDLRRLERLDVQRNALTREGEAALLRVLGTALRADHQQTAEELARGQYLYEGDFE